MINDHEVASSSNPPLKPDDDDDNNEVVNCKDESNNSFSKEEDYIQCKFGFFKCIYCTHGGCLSKKE